MRIVLLIFQDKLFCVQKMKIVLSANENVYKPIIKHMQDKIIILHTVKWVLQNYIYIIFIGIGAKKLEQKN